MIDTSRFWVLDRFSHFPKTANTIPAPYWKDLQATTKTLASESFFVIARRCKKVQASLQ